jgi:hypothetical protein
VLHRSDLWRKARVSAFADHFEKAQQHVRSIVCLGRCFPIPQHDQQAAAVDHHVGYMSTELIGRHPERVQATADLDGNVAVRVQHQAHLRIRQSLPQLAQ